MLGRLLINRGVFILPLFFQLFYVNVCSQDSINNNYSDLSRFTFGVHFTNYKNGFFITDDARYSSFIEINPAKSIFFDYRIVNYKNHALRFGVFLNSFNHYLKYNGEAYDIMSGTYREVDGEPYGGASLYKARTIEYYLNYNYLLKIKNNVHVEAFLGLSYEKNLGPEFAEVGNRFTTGPPDWIPYQTNFYSIYLMEGKFYRYHFGTSVAYKTEVGMFNLGFKYSIPFKNMLFGNSTFFDPGPNGENFEYYNYYSVSGRYLSFTLSYTPIKGLFKKNK